MKYYYVNCCCLPMVRTFSSPLLRNVVIILFCIFNLSYTCAANRVIIPVETAHTTLLLETDSIQRLLITYFGAKLQNESEYLLVDNQMNQKDVNAGVFNHAYTPSGTWCLVEPALQITHSDGNLSTELYYVSHKTEKVDNNVKVISVLLKDNVYNTEITLYYKVYYNEDVIEQWSAIKNREKGTITLNKYASANLNFVAKNYYLTHFNGAWAREMKPEQTMLTHGIKVLDSKLGTRADLFQHPAFILSFNQQASEDEGEVLLGTLAWSGNFKMEFEIDTYHNLRLIAGINPYSSEYPLTSGKEFVTPSFISVLSQSGIGNASRQLHRWARTYRLLDGNGSRLTLLNNWEATGFDFDENQLVKLFADGKKLGVDLFLLDDGWFGNKFPRNDDKHGLGDWKPNTKKLPNGISYLVKEADKVGVKFGIWVEPEMVNPKSELYINHPEWVIKNKERPEYYCRNQLVLDLSNPEVQDYIYNVMNNLLTANNKLAFIKWDCNSVIFNAYSEYLHDSKQSQSQLYVDYVRGLYNVLERIRVKFPNIPMMLCSGGGGRVDYAALKYFTEFWLSDNTDPKERAFIQWNYSYFYPTIAHCNHITDWSKASLKYRTDVAMMGKMGYDIMVDKLSIRDLEFSQNAVVTYNSIKDLIWHGDLYRLMSPYDNPYEALMFVNEERARAIVFSYLISNRFDITYSPTPLKLKGLDPQKRYHIHEINMYNGTKSTLDEKNIFTGDFLMKIGFNPDITIDRSSVVLEITEVK